MDNNLGANAPDNVDPSAAQAFTMRLDRSRAVNIQFTGSGSEYFRIWIVNLLLIIVTAGLYFPFAKARRLNYFYANTRIDGHALAFHGDPWRMFRGFVLLGVLMGTYGVAGRISPAAGLVAFIALCAVWPALWRASMQFRLANTSWRGLRFAFRGSLGGAYAGFLPGILSTLPFIATALYAGAAQRTGQPQDMLSVKTLMSAMGLAVLAIPLVMPWGLAILKRYQHGGYAYASQQTQLFASTWDFYKLVLKGLGVSLLAFLALITLIAVGFGIAYAMGDIKNSVIAIVIGAGAYLIFLSLTQAYYASRMQNLVWNGTKSENISFQSRLGALDLTKLNAVNWFLTAITLSLYRPFAAVATTRLRLESMTVTLEGDVESWQGSTAQQQDATGDAAGDFFGIDMGL